MIHTIGFMRKMKLELASSQIIEGVKLPYSISVFVAEDEYTNRSFRRYISENFDKKDVSVRMEQQLNMATINFRNEVDAANFLMIMAD